MSYTVTTESDVIGVTLQISPFYGVCRVLTFNNHTALLHPTSKQMLSLGGFVANLELMVSSRQAVGFSSACASDEGRVSVQVLSSFPLITLLQIPLRNQIAMALLQEDQLRTLIAGLTAPVEGGGMQSRLASSVAVNH